MRDLDLYSQNCASVSLQPPVLCPYLRLCFPSLADPSAGVNCFNMVLSLVFRVIMRLLSFFFKCGHPLCPSFACLPRQPRSSITKNKQKYIAPSVTKLPRSKQFKRFRRLKCDQNIFHRTRNSIPKQVLLRKMISANSKFHSVSNLCSGHTSFILLDRLA